MPVYEFECRDCGSFTELRSLDRSSLPANCPSCGEVSPKVFSVINLRAMRPENRTAHAPHVCGSGGSHTHGRPKSRAKKQVDKPALQYSIKPNSRPWMLGH